MQNPDALVKAAVQDIVTYINDGLSPQAATEKVAVELQLNHNFIKRASEAVNVALHYDHFKKNASDKSADFPIVDAQQVVNKVYGTKEKTASEFKSELFSSFQSEEIAPKFSRYLEEGPHKEAYTKLVNEEPDKRNTISEKGLYEKSANYIRDLKKVAEEKVADAKEAEYQVNRSFCRILEKFAKAEDTRTSFAEFESQVFSTHGDASVPYLDLLYKASHLKEDRGTHDVNYKMFNPSEETKAFGSFLKQATELADIKKEAEDAEYNYNYEKSFVSDIFKKRGEELFNNNIDESIIAKISSEIEHETKSLTEDVEDPVLLAIKQKKEAQFKEEVELIKASFDFINSAMDAAKGQGKPSLSATTNSESDNRERAFLLQELASTDSILNKVPTKKIVDSYQQLLRIAPEISKEKEMVRSYLRQAVNTQALDPFQGQQLIEADTKRLKQRQLQQGIGSNKDKGD